MKKFLISFIALFFIGNSVFADVLIKKENRVRNREPGWCAWVCLETLGKHHRIPKLYNLSIDRMNDPDEIIINSDGYREFIPRNAATKETAQRKLDSLKVNYEIRTGEPNWLKHNTIETGCVVFMNPPAFSEGHAIILTEFNEETIGFINPNDCRYYIASREWFDAYFSHVAIVVFPDEITK